jgi:transcriptional regulator with XRE-family HTH domain
MGAKSQNRPKNLARKLLQIRNALGLSQSQMLRRLGAQDSFSAARISEYETGTREPSFWMLLNYGRVARVHVESLIDDTATLPAKLPGNFNFKRSQQRLARTSARSKASGANSPD